MSGVGSRETGLDSLFASQPVGPGFEPCLGQSAKLAGAPKPLCLSVQIRPILLLCICKPCSVGSLRGHHHACCIWPLGGHPHAFPVQLLGGQPCGNVPSMVLLGSASDHLTMIPLPSVHACMPALILPYLLLPLHLQLTYHSLKTCAGAPG